MKIVKYQTFTIVLFLLIALLKGNAQPIPFDKQVVDSITQQLPIMRDDTNKVKSLILLAQMYISMGKGDEVMQFARTADSLSQKIQYNLGRIAALGQMAFYHVTIGDWPNSIMEINEAIPLTKKEKTDWSVYLYNLKFINYASKNDLKTARFWALKALSHPSFKDLQDMAKWPTYVQLGLSYEWENQLDSAQFYANILKEYVKKYHHVDLEGNTYSLLGNIARKKKNYDEALRYYRMGEQNTMGIAWVYDEQNKVDSAIYYAKLTLDFAQSRNDPRLLLESTQLLARRYAKTNPTLSNKYLQLYVDTKDTLFNANKLKQLEEIRLTEQKQRFDQDSQDIAFKNRMIQFALIGIAFLFLISALFFFRNNQIKQTANRKLEKAYSELKTTQTQLEFKNHDLEIEAATERVRMQSMAMQHPSDFEKVNKELLHQLTKLKIDGLSGISFYFIDEDEIVTVWDLSSPGSMNDPNNYSFKYDSKKYPVLGGFVEILKTTQEDYFILDFPKPSLLQGIEELKEINITIAEATKNAVESGALLHQWNPAARITDGILSIDLMKPPGDDTKTILLKMAGAFNQAYTRFLDLQKAEAQAREAQIEAALERVRNRTLLMKDSSELNEAVAVFFQQFKSLNLLPHEARTYFCHINADAEVAEVWMTHADGTVMNTSHQTPLTKSPSLLNYYEAWKRKEPILVRNYSGDALTEYLQFLSTLPHVKADKDYQQLFSSPPEKIVMTDANFLHGNIGIMTFEPLTQDALDILVRFAKIFEFTYSRFLDLQKAEAQAREAQIEVALEKVRSRSLAMHKSDELNEVVDIVFEKLHELNIIFDGGVAIQTFTEGSKESTVWVTDPRLASSSAFRLLYPNDTISDHKIISDFWNQKEKGADLISQAYSFDDKNAYFNYVFTDSDLKHMPDEVKSGILSAKGYAHSVAIEKNTAVTVSSFLDKLLSDKENEILKRFSKVFEQSYTRFLDLQKAEAQAEQARLDLILIQTEKKRAETALTELRVTQAQLIQKEKLASLGELTAGIAHEIQNPLNFVNNFSELSVDLAKEINEEMDKELIDKDLVKDLVADLSSNQEKINHHGKRASNIVKGMLEHSRASTGERELTDINALADEYLRLSYHGLRAKDKNFNADYKTDFETPLSKISIVPQDMGRVLLNLYNNAFYAVHQRQQLDASSKLASSSDNYTPSVLVTIKQLDNQIIITVKDNGIGMSESVKAKIFQPFFTTKPTGEGTGLGLSLAYDIVTKGHGGTLEVVSTEEVGTEFIITLLKS